MNHLLEDVFSPKYARKGDVDLQRARDSLSHGAATLLQRSVLAEGWQKRKVAAEAGGRFLGQLARAEAAAKEISFASALGQMLTGIGRYLPLPGPYKSGARVAGAILEEVGTENAPRTWAGDAIEGLMYRVYETEHPRPEGSDDSEAVRNHEAEFLEWQEDARDAYVAEVVVK
jgi:hypothetical protein